MKDSLKTFPYACTAGDMESWVRRFKNELRQIIKSDCSSLEAKWLIIDGEAYIKVKEILGVA